LAGQTQGAGSAVLSAANPPAFDPAGRTLMLRTQAQPTGELLASRELRHVRADLAENDERRGLVDALDQRQIDAGHLEQPLADVETRLVVHAFALPRRAAPPPSGPRHGHRCRRRADSAPAAARPRSFSLCALPCQPPLEVGRRRGSAWEKNSLPNGDTQDVPPRVSAQAPGTMLTVGHKAPETGRPPRPAAGLRLP